MDYRCRDCEFWTEDLLGFRGVYRAEDGYCHIEPKKIYKNGNDFCGRIKPIVQKEIKN